MKTFSDIRQLAFIFTISLFSIVLINCTGGGTQGRGLMSSSGGRESCWWYVRIVSGKESWEIAYKLFLCGR